MTSNIGSELILKAKEIAEEIKFEIKKQLHKTFRPEFLNRIDEIVFFNMITQSMIKNIAKIHIKDFEERMVAKDIQVTITDKALDIIAQEGYEPEFGARPLKRAIQQLIIVPVSRHILMHPNTKKIAINAKNDQIVIEDNK